MIYLDNAATTLLKPPGVAEAVANAISTFGSPGRGAHSASITASRAVYKARRQIASLIGAESASDIAFCSNATEALNTAIHGIFSSGDHVITTVTEHNSALRPLYLAQMRGTEVSYIHIDSRGILDYKSVEKLIKNNTKAFVINHASNVTGNTAELDFFIELKKKYGLLLITDGAQSAGTLPINVKDIDVFCFTGHKGLMGPQGTGGIYVKPGIKITPLKSGGSGIRSFDRLHPDTMPEALEAGTLNSHGIAGLSCSLEFISKTGVDSIHKKESALCEIFLDNLDRNEDITVYGDVSAEVRVPVISLNISDMSSSYVSGILAEEYGIATRAGAHCAPLIHNALGTAERGAVRFSFSYFNTEDDAIKAAKAVNEIAKYN